MGATGSWTGAGAGPSLLSVAQVGNSLRVYFDEPMTDNADLRDPTHYVFTPLGGGDPTTTLTVTPGPGTYPSYVDLSISNATTSGSSYQLAADASLIDAAGNPMDAGGLTITFLGFGSGVVPLDDLGIIEAITGVFGEELAEVGGFRMTRLVAAVSEGDATFHVESTLDWDEEGFIAVDGVKYAYTGKSITSFTGISHIAAGASVVGASTDHRDESAVMDLNRNWSGLDLLRRGFLVEYAEGADLNALGRNLGVERPPIFADDDQFRAVIQAVAYNPKGTVLGLELALEALVGAGNYEVYEDLIQFPNTVFIRVDTASFLEATAAGRAFLGHVDYDDLGGTQDELVLGEIPLAVGSVRLKPMDFLFDFRDDIPSDVDMEPWPGETPINPWVFESTESEGTAVVNTPGQYTSFTSSTSHIRYNMSPVDGMRITEDSDYRISTVFMIPSAATLSAVAYGQCAVACWDGSRIVSWGVQDNDPATYRLYLYDTGGAVGGGPAAMNKDQWYDVTLVKKGQVVELWVDGLLVNTAAYTDFNTNTNYSGIYFGILGVQAGMVVRYKQIGVEHSTITDYWSARGAAGSVATANPRRFDDGAALLTVADVGKFLTISGGSVSNGINNGHWLIDSYVSPGVVELIGPEWTDAAVVSSPDRIVVEDEEAFTYPDDIGKRITISGSSLGNDGTYVIAALREPGTLKDYSTYDTPITGAKTNICDVTAGGFTAEPDLEWQLVPAFQTEASLDWVLSDASSFATNTLTLRQGLWINGLVMEIHYSNVLSAQLLADVDVENTVGAGPTYEYWPFYLADPFGLVQAYMDDLTAAGVIPEFESL